ncbi:LysE family translocator [bacterium]|nr:LysE family translocator [bacterium]
MPFLQGLLIGLSTAIILGPVFFTLIKNSIQHGVKEGIAAATGIIVSDILVFVLCYFLAASFIKDFIDDPRTRLVGIVIIFSIGVSYILKNVKNDEAQDENGVSGKAWSSFVQGFAVNFFNPVVFVIWLSFIAIAEKQEFSDWKLYAFVIGIFTGIYSTDILKVFFAQKIKQWLSPHHLLWVYRIIGGILAISAVYMFITTR